MKFALALVTVALVAAVNAAPKGTFFGTELKGSGLEQVQIDVLNIGEAARLLDVTEDKLKALSEGKDVIAGAKDTMKTAVDNAALEEENVRFPHDSGK